MAKQILAQTRMGQTRVALLENGNLTEYYVEQSGRENIVGNVYKGRVANVLPGMQAAFVDIGLERNAFLYVGDILVDKSDFDFSGNGQQDVDEKLKNTSIRQMLKPGQEIIVQVLKEPTGAKGARVSTHITLPGRTLVLMPTMNYVGVSRRVDDEAERGRLKDIADRIRPQNMGLIVRTVAEGKEARDFDYDIAFLMRLWGNIQKRAQRSSAPRLIHGEVNLAFRTVRDLFSEDVDQFIIDDEELYARVSDVVSTMQPHLSDRVLLHPRRGLLFDEHRVETKVDKALARKVWLKNGAYIVIESTEALTVIDVNTGKFVGSDNLEETIFQTNLQAAREIALQLRLRDIGGIIVVDFIDMDEEEHRQRVVDALRQALKNDRTKTNVLGITALSLVEITRKKVRQPLSQMLERTCPYCNGSGRIVSEQTVAMKVLSELRRAREAGDAPLLAELHPSVAEKLIAGAQSEGGLKINPPVYLRTMGQGHIEQFHVAPALDVHEMEAGVGAGDLIRLL